LTDTPSEKSLANLEQGKGYFARDPAAAKAAQLKGAASRTRNAKFREILQDLLKLKAPDKVQKKLEEFFPEIKDRLTNQQAMSLRMVLEAVDGKSKPFKMITDIIDGLPKQSIKMEGELSFHKKLEDLEKYTDIKTLDKIKKALEDEENEVDKRN
jgi:hypothetical protein